MSEYSIIKKDFHKNINDMTIDTTNIYYFYT